MVNKQIKENSLRIVLAPGVEMEFVCVPAGEFLMGSDKKIDTDAYKDELPQHKVYLDEYLIGKYPVTNGQYAAFVKATGQKIGSFSKEKENHPVTQVSWVDAAAFCDWATKMSGKTIHLPSEAEWEKAARGGDGRIYPWGNQEPGDIYCNYSDIFECTTPVGYYSPKGDSPYGCTDMAGNVWEWVNDWYAEDYYKNSPKKNPPGAASGLFRVSRGGSWSDIPMELRSSNRLRMDATVRDDNLGFRCATG